MINSLTANKMHKSFETAAENSKFFFKNNDKTTPRRIQRQNKYVQHLSPFGSEYSVFPVRM
jgi:hypothetical protein